MPSLTNGERAGSAPYVLAKGKAYFAALGTTLAVPVPGAANGDLVFVTYMATVDAQYIASAVVSSGVLTITRGGTATNVAAVYYMVVSAQS